MSSSSSSSPLAFNSFSSDRRNNKPTRRSASVDDLSLVKAAAWAWYQHGSLNERPIHELNLERAEKVQKPSRYKLEAIKAVEQGNHHKHSSSTIPILLSSSPSHSHDGYYISKSQTLLARPMPNSNDSYYMNKSQTLLVRPVPNSDDGYYISDLLDKYEIQRISCQLDRYIETSHAAAFCGALLGDCDRRGVAPLSESGTNDERKNKKPPSKGFWLRHAAVVCGSSNTDVVETRSVGSPRRRPPAKYVPAVKIVGCGPRGSRI